MMRKIFQVQCIIMASVLMVFYFCQERAGSANLTYTDTLPALFANKVTLGSVANKHLGHCEIDAGILVAQVFEKQQRNNEQLYIADINGNKEIGFFKWLATQKGSLNFSNFARNGKLLYLNGNKYLYTIDLATSKQDTTLLKSDFEFLSDFVAVGDNLFSINNLYGISAISMLDSTREIRVKPFRDQYFYMQNNLSIPVVNDLNLLASGNPKDSIYTVFAVDSLLGIKWSKTLALKDRFEPIASRNYAEHFLLKYDYTIEKLSKTDGASVWTKRFDQHIFHFFFDSTRKKIMVILSKSDAPISSPGQSGDNTGTKDFIVTQLNESDGRTEWTEKISCKNISTFYANERELFLFSSDNETIHFIFGNKTTTRLKTNNKDIRILTDKITGRDYLLKDNVIYW